MDSVELLKVEDTFLIKGRGLILVPSFAVPDGWVNRIENVIIVKPDGSQLQCMAQFNLSHFNMADPTASIEQRWQVVVILPDQSKEDIPVGSTVFGSPALGEQLLPQSEL